MHEHFRSRGENRHWERRPSWLDSYCKFLPQSDDGASLMTHEPVRILLIRRMMQIWYSWKGGREGRCRPFDTSFPPVRCLRLLHDSPRENPQSGTQEATRQGRGNQEKDQLLFHSRSSREIRRKDAQHLTSCYPATSAKPLSYSTSHSRISSGPTATISQNTKRSTKAPTFATFPYA